MTRTAGDPMPSSGGITGYSSRAAAGAKKATVQKTRSAIAAENRIQRLSFFETAKNRRLHDVKQTRLILQARRALRILV
jgi:hypothetical protein